MTDSKQTPFTLTEPRYDSNTYGGRFMQISEASNVRYAFISNNEVLRQYEIIKNQEKREQEAFEKTGSRKVMLSADEIETLRHAVNITKAAIHPDTLEPIPMVMRMTFFLPGNLPISMGMIFSAPTMFNTIFWQVANQTYNAALNFGNANKSSPAKAQDIMMSYCAAVTAACLTGATIRKLTGPMIAGATGARLTVLNSLTSMTSVAIGGFVNNFAIRQPEVMSGIGIQDPANQQQVGVSKKCADAARWQTATSRIAMALPLMFPAAVMVGIERMGLMPKGNIALNVLRLTLLAMQLTFAVPVSMACYPQYQMIPAKDLEPEFQNMKSEVTGETIKEFRYNKGL